MTKFVGAEYVIANMLISKLLKGENIVSLTELSRCGTQIQHILTSESIDAVFLTSRSEIYNAIFDFSDYFQCKYDEDEQLEGITINKCKKIDDLQKRFVGYIPKQIVDVLTKAIDQMVA